MVYWKIWHDVKNRFYVSFIISILLALSLVVLFPFTQVIVNYLKEDMSPEDYATVQRYTLDYRLFMDEGWFNEIGFVSLFAIVLALGGVMTEVRTRSILLTLSLPVSRSRWVVSQGLFSAFLVFLITACCSLLILAGGWGMGKTFPLLRAIEGTLLIVAGCLPWIAIALMITAFTQDRLKASLYSFLVWLAAGPLERFHSLEPWLPQSIVKTLESAPFPWQAWLSLLIVSTACWWIAIKIFESRDF